MPPKYDDSGRVCSVCGEYKLWREFSWKRPKKYKDSEKTYQLKQPKCKNCAQKETDSWREKQSSERLKDLYYQRTYGLSLKGFNSMFVSQKGQCLLCKTDLALEGHPGNRAVVDHCHTKGHIRGILCNECNRGLGYFKDSPTTLLNAVKYLEGTL